FQFEVSIKNVKKWSPVTPTLYNLSLTLFRNGEPLTTETVRFGFREASVNKGRFALNGKPVFLRGATLNPPAPGILVGIGQKKAFIRDYIRDLKSRNINIIRMESENYEELCNWLDACDELGVMVLQGRYGIPAGGTEKDPPMNLNAAFGTYKSYFQHFAGHPSVVAYILANEAGTAGSSRRNYNKWLAKLAKKVKRWNPGVICLNNAGGGDGAGDLEDYHFYDGWYRDSFLGYLDWRQASGVMTPQQAVTPITLSECLGAFTTPQGEFSVSPRQLGASLCWGGSEIDDPKAGDAYQSFLMKYAIEQFRRERRHNPRLGGIMPYTILYSNWGRVRVFSDMRPKVAADTMRMSFQPVLPSWEVWTPNMYAGKQLSTRLHIINDSDRGEDLTGASLTWELIDLFGNIVNHGELELPVIKYYSSQVFPVEVEIPEKAAAGTYSLTATIKSGGRLVSANNCRLFVGNEKFVHKGQVYRGLQLCDPSGMYDAGMKELGVAFTVASSLTKLNGVKVLVLGKGIDENQLAAEAEELQAYIRNGGRVLCLEPTDGALKALGIKDYVKMVDVEAKQGMFINRIRRNAALFGGLPSDGLAYWNDYSTWDESKSGYPRVAPVRAGLQLCNPNMLMQVEVLANFGHGLANIALARVSYGKGAIVISGFDFLPRFGRDPLADRFFCNLLSYCSEKKEHEQFPVVGQVIKWGDLTSEMGMAAVPESGLLLNGILNQRVMSGPNTPDYQVMGRRIAGPFMFNSNNELVFLGSEIGAAQFLATLPQKYRSMILTFINPTGAMQQVSIQINGMKPQVFELGANEEGDCLARLPIGSSDIRVVLRAHRDLILKETRFE
ncbi:MAG: glycoside hydrolase family 2 TIM barrel-domain containing protein, partial [Victivallales bacterium]|nr:glycoside hydrolase family 2 TIM barrel-domain containing protein [Victivallales bacterium]